MTGASLTSRVLRGLVWDSLGTAGQSAAALIVLIVLARLLGPADFGVVGAAMVVMGLTEIAARFGVAPALVQAEECSEHTVQVAYSLSLALGILSTLALVGIAESLAALFGIAELAPVIQILALSLPIGSLGAVASALQQRSMAFRTMATVHLASYAVGYAAVGITLAWLGYGVWALVVAHLTQVTLCSIAFIVLRRDVFGFRLAPHSALRLFRFGSGYTLARFASYVANQADNVVVARGLGAEALGLYGRAYQLLMAPANLVGSVLDRVLFPAMASVQADVRRLKAGFMRAVGGTVLVTAPLTAFLVAMASELVLVLLGSDWLEVVAPFRVLVAFLVFRTSYKACDSLARATGAVFRRAWRQWLYAFAVVLGSWLGLQLGGLTGVALGVGLAILLNYGLMMQLSVMLTGANAREIGSIFMRHAAIAAIVLSAAWGSKIVAVQAHWHPLAALSLAAITSVTAWLSAWKAVPSLFGPEGADAKLMLGKVFKRLGHRPPLQALPSHRALRTKRSGSRVDADTEDE